MNLLRMIAAAGAGLVVVGHGEPGRVRADGQRELPPDPAVHYGELSNGVRYAIMPNREPRDRVSLRLFFRAGSLHERDDQRGLAHYLEHMAFKGTAHFTPGSMVAYFQNLGMNFGPDANAYTGFERTVYQIELPENSLEAVDEALFVFREYADRMLLDPAEIDAERGVILSEKRTRDTVGFRTARAEFAFLLPEAVLAERFPIGDAAVIRAADSAALRAFYESWYRPERTFVVVVGAIEPEAVEPLIARQFGDFSARRPEPPLPPIGRVTVRETLDARFQAEPEAPAVQVRLHCVQPCRPRPDSARRRIERMIRSVALEMVNRRFDRLSQQADAPFSRAGVGAYERFDFYANAVVALQTRPEHWRRALQSAEQELRRALRFGFLEDELAEVRANRIQALEDAVRRAPTRRSRDLAERLVRSFSDRTVMTDSQTEHDLLRPVLESLDVEACLAALRDAFPEGNRRLFVSGRIEIPDADTALPDLWHAAAALPVDPPAARIEAPFAYTDFGPPGTVTRADHVADLDLHQFRFANQVRLNIKRTDFAANEVLLAVRIGAGRLTEPVTQPGLALLATKSLIAGGLGEHSADQIRRRFAGRNVGWDFQVEHDAFVFRGRTTPEDLAAQLQLLAAYLSDPGFRPEALRLARDRFEESLRAARHTAQGVLQDRAARYLAGGDMRFGLPSEDEWQALDLEDVRRWLAPPLAGAWLEVSLLGDTGDLDAVRQAVAATLGALPERAREKNRHEERRRLSRPDGDGAVFEFSSRIPSGMVAVYWPTTDMWDIARNRRLSVLARVFSDRMRERIREQMGEAYSPFAFSNTSETYHDYGWMTGLVGVDPAQAGVVANEVIRIASELHGGRIGEDALQRALRPLLASLRDLQRGNAYWLNSVLISSQEHPQRLDWARTMRGDFESISVADLAELAHRYLDPERALTVVLVPVDPRDETDEPGSAGP